MDGRNRLKSERRDLQSWGRNVLSVLVYEAMQAGKRVMLCETAGKDERQNGDVDEER